MSQDKVLYHIRNGIDQLSDLEFSNQISSVNKFLNDAVTSRNFNVLIGSGCSFPAVPLMGQTFNEIKVNNPNLILGKFNGNNNDIEGYLNWLNTGIKFYEDNTGNFNETSNVGQYKDSFEFTKNELIKTIPTVYENEDGTFNDVKQNYINFYNAILSIRGSRNYSPPNIFTTNYDLFNEVAMESLNIHYINGFRGVIERLFDPSTFHLRLVDDQHRYKEKWSVVRNFIKLYKIHGSINWYFENDKVREKSDFTNADNAVIYPTINKHLETQQTPYSELFRELTINLQKPDSTLLILGYGFPDQHINQLISQALSNEDFSLVVFGDKNESNASLFLNKFKDHKNFHFIGGSISSENDGHHFSNVISYLEGDSFE